MDEARFASDLDDGVYAAYVSSLEKEAAGIGLPGTPSALVDGEIVAGQGLPVDFAVWDNFISSTIAVQALDDMQYDAPPPMTLEDGKIYKARVTMENGDEFLIELNQEAAPLAVNSFVFLANEGWFDGVTFHRVLPGFMAQTGDPTGTGMGGPGYEFVNEIDPALSHEPKGSWRWPIPARIPMAANSLSRWLRQLIWTAGIRFSAVSWKAWTLLKVSPRVIHPLTPRHRLEI